VRTRKELTAEDFLRVVGGTPGNGAVVPHSNGSSTHQLKEETVAVIEVVVETAAVVREQVTISQEDAACQNGQKGSSRNGYQQASSPRPTKSEAPSSWFERLQRCSTWPPLPPV
jgi:hypothetical protein